MGEKTQKQKIGKIGEDCACIYLQNHGFSIIDRNYLRKWGELDIVAIKDKVLHFVEVKSVSRHLNNVSGVTSRPNDSYRPEDNMHPWKLKRLGRAIQTYLLENEVRLERQGSVSSETDWQFDVATVYVDMDKRLSRVHLLEDVVIG
jgi:putative endonuclease